MLNNYRSWKVSLAGTLVLASIIAVCLHFTAICQDYSTSIHGSTTL